MAKDNRGEAYPRVLAGRFGKYFGQLGRVHESLTVSRLAEQLKYGDSRFLDRMSDGREYMRWRDMEDFCARSGLDADWFKHGEGEPFARSDACQVDVTALLNELDGSGEWRVYFARSDCREGRVCFVRRDNDVVWRIYPTLLHLSGVNGAGGARNLVGLYRLLKEINASWMSRTASFTLPRAEFEALEEGKVFPGAVLCNRMQCHWADDFPLLEPSGAHLRKLIAGHGPEFQAAQSIVRAQLAFHGEGEEDGRSGRGSESASGTATGTGQDDLCPVCAYRRRSIVAKTEDFGNRFVVDCPRCGPFRIGRGAVRRVEAGAVSTKKLSAWIRGHKESGGVPPTILQEGLDAVVAGLPEYSVADKQRLLLGAIARRTEPSESADLVLEDEFPVAWAASAGELRYLLRALGDRGLVRASETAARASCEITPAGWEHLDSMEPTRRLGKQVFVAMSFDPDLEEAWEKGIMPALAEVGYEPYRVDKEQHLERIDVKVHDEIDHSKFLVADVTGHRQGVYFEAGYALGQGLRVVWCVREDDLGKVHFDTRQFNHVIWQNPADLRRKLAERVAGAIGEG